MPEIVGAIVGALAVIGIPLIGWFSRRATREGRLILRVERLGAAYALMPDSPERDTFTLHLTNAISNLNRWLDPENATRRRSIRRISVAIYVVGVLVALVAIPLTNATATPWVTSVVGAAIGTAISGITLGASYLLERGARRKAASELRARDVALASERMEALRRGVPHTAARAN